MPGVSGAPSPATLRAASSNCVSCASTEWPVVWNDTPQAVLYQSHRQLLGTSYSYRTHSRCVLPFFSRIDCAIDRSKRTLRFCYSRRTSNERLSTMRDKYKRTTARIAEIAVSAPKAGCAPKVLTMKRGNHVLLGYLIWHCMTLASTLWSHRPEASPQDALSYTLE